MRRSIGVGGRLKQKKKKMAKIKRIMKERRKEELQQWMARHAKVIDN